MTPDQVVCGAIVRVNGDASCQFAGQDFLLRVIGTDTYGSTPTGWLWIDGYVLNACGEAVDRRRLFLQPAGLTQEAAPATRAVGRARVVRAARTRNTGPHIPKQRTKNTTGSTR